MLEFLRNDYLIQWIFQYNRGSALASLFYSVGKLKLNTISMGKIQWFTNPYLNKYHHFSFFEALIIQRKIMIIDLLSVSFKIWFKDWKIFIWNLFGTFVDTLVLPQSKFLSPPMGQSRNILLIVGPLIMGHLSILVTLYKSM